MDNIDNDKGILEHAITKDNDNQQQLDGNRASEDYQQIIIKTKSTYICTKNIVDDNVEKKKRNNETKIIREYKNLISFEELVARIIKYHSQDNYIENYETTETK